MGRDRIRGNLKTPNQLSRADKSKKDKKTKTKKQTKRRMSARTRRHLIMYTDEKTGTVFQITAFLCASLVSSWSVQHSLLMYKVRACLSVWYLSNSSANNCSAPVRSCRAGTQSLPPTTRHPACARWRGCRPWRTTILRGWQLGTCTLLLL